MYFPLTVANVANVHFLHLDLWHFRKFLALCLPPALESLVKLLGSLQLTDLGPPLEDTMHHPCKQNDQCSGPNFQTPKLLTAVDCKLFVTNRFGPASVFVASLERTLVPPEAPKLLQVAHLLFVRPLVMGHEFQELASPVWIRFRMDMMKNLMINLPVGAHGHVVLDVLLAAHVPPILNKIIIMIIFDSLKEGLTFSLHMKQFMIRSTLGLWIILDGVTV